MLNRTIGLTFLLLFGFSLSQASILSLRNDLAKAVMAEDRQATLQQLSKAYLAYNLDSALYFSDQALIVSEDLGDVLGQAHALHGMGKAHSNLGSYALADSCFRLSSEYYLAMGDLFGQADNFFGQGEAYGFQGEQDSADLYFSKALSYFEDGGDPELTLKIYLQYGRLLFNWKRNKEAEAQADKVIRLARIKNKDLLMADGFTLKGDARRVVDNHRGALVEYRRALGYYEKAGLTEKEARILKYMSMVHRNLGKAKVSRNYAHQALEKAHEADSRAEAMDIYQLLSDLMADKQDFQKAYDYARLHTLMRDSMLGNGSAGDLNDILEKFEKEKLQLENEKAAQEIKLQETKIALQDEELKAERIRLIAVLGGLGLLLIFGIVLAISNVQRKRANQRLAEALANLKRTQNQLVRSEKLASLGQVTAGIAHEIRNPLNFVNNLSQLSVDMVDELKEELSDLEGQSFTGEPAEIVQEYFADLQENSGKINHHGRRASRIVQDMLAHASSGEQQKAPVEFNLLVEEYLQLAYQSQVSKRDFNCELVFEGDAQIDRISVVSSDLGRALLNLFNNAFEAFKESTQPEPLVRVSTHLQGKEVVVKVYDNGSGIDPAHLPRIFDPFFTTKPPAEGTGLGLSLAHEAVVQLHGGSLSVTSEAGQWTEFVMTLPMAPVAQKK